MKAKLILCLTIACGWQCQAQELVGEYDWEVLRASGKVITGEPASLDGRSALKIVNTNNSVLTAELLRIEAPRISSVLYAIRGEIKYENVHGDGFLEMWSCFPPEKPKMLESKYFSRTLGKTGEMGKVTGRSNWREFTLPFNRAGLGGPPNRIELNLVLPGSGTVYIGRLKLEEYAGSSFSGTGANAWWPDRTGGFIGGIAGATLGCLGSLLEWLASRGKARSFVLNATRVLIGSGCVVGGAWIVAILTKQPYGVWFVLLLIGGLELLILPPRLRRYERRYEEIELRRMASADALKI